MCRRSLLLLLVLTVASAGAPALALADDAGASPGATATASPDSLPAPPATVPTPAAAAANAPPGEVDVAPGAARRAPRADRPWVAAAVLGGVYAPFTVWSYFAWYYNKPNLPAFKVGGDGYFGLNTYAGGADKLGHFWINLALSRGTTELLRWSGWRRTPAAILASSASFAFFVFVEIKDGFYYEMSPGDLIANGLGSIASAAMVTMPRLDELLDFRMQYAPSPRFRRELAGGNVDIAEDYSGQTFVTALHLGALPGVKDTAAADWLRFVDLSLAYQTRGYKPDPAITEVEDRSTDLFVGFSLNLQGVVDATLSGRKARGARIAGKIGHGIFEVYQPPYTILPVASSTRYLDR